MDDDAGSKGICPTDLLGPSQQDIYDDLMEDKLWGNIRRAARTNISLQSALNDAIVIYRLCGGK